MTSSVEHFDLKTQAAAPLTFSFPITPTCSFNTTVTGDARATALVTIMNGSIAVWGATLMQLSPTATLTYDLKVGVDTVKAGTTFTLTIPTTSQMGSLVATTTIASPTNPQGIQFQAAIANWPLVSTL